MWSPSVLCSVAAALLATQVDAHGYLVQPAAKFKPGVMTTNYNGVIDSSKLAAPFAGKKFNDNPTANAKTFTDAFKQSKYKSIKELMDPVVGDCGNTLMDGAPVDVSGMKSVKWANDQERVGFIKSHTGPCEVWIDNKMVFQETGDCVAKFTGYPAELPVDFSVCKGKCQLTFYWLALHEPNWQVYKQCAPIQNGGGGGAAAGGNNNNNGGNNNNNNNNNNNSNNNKGNNGGNNNNSGGNNNQNKGNNNNNNNNGSNNNQNKGNNGGWGNWGNRGNNNGNQNNGNRNYDFSNLYNNQGGNNRQGGRALRA